MTQTKYTTRRSKTFNLSQQKGVSLLELMVGIAIGLMVVLAAVSSLVLNKTSSTTITDTSVLTNQANSALRVISFYARQAGALQAQPTGNPKEYLLGNPPPSPIPPPIPTAAVRGNENSGPNSSDNVTFWVSHLADGITRDCLGNSIPVIGGMMQNQFFLATNANGERRLMCLGATPGAAAEPLANNVEDFQVLYAENTGTTTDWRTANNVANWGNVIAVDICLQIRGEINHGTTPSPHVPCNSTTPVTATDGRLRIVARQVIQLRNRGTNTVNS